MSKTTVEPKAAATPTTATQYIAEATAIVGRCERDLGRFLSKGEVRDLLMDNTAWESSVVSAIADHVFEGR